MNMIPMMALAIKKKHREKRMRLPSVKWSPFAMPFGLINLLCSGYFLTSHPCSQELSSFWFLCYSTLEREVPP